MARFLTCVPCADHVGCHAARRCAIRQARIDAAKALREAAAARKQILPPPAPKRAAPVTRRQALPPEAYPAADELPADAKPMPLREAAEVVARHWRLYRERGFDAAIEMLERVLARTSG